MVKIVLVPYEKWVDYMQSFRSKKGIDFALFIH